LIILENLVQRSVDQMTSSFCINKGFRVGWVYFLTYIHLLKKELWRIWDMIIML